MKHRPTMLMILDGYGVRPETEGNAVAAANTPVLDSIMENCPAITLDKCNLHSGRTIYRFAPREISTFSSSGLRRGCGTS